MMIQQWSTVDYQGQKNFFFFELHLYDTITWQEFSSTIVSSVEYLWPMLKQIIYKQSLSIVDELKRFLKV